MDRCKDVGEILRPFLMRINIIDGILRKTYLKEHRKAYYQMLIRQGKLNKHLNKVDREAHERMDVLVAQMAEKQGVTELFKAEQPMLWVRKMNGIRTAAEEMVLTEIVYG